MPELKAAPGLGVTVSPGRTRDTAWLTVTAARAGHALQRYSAEICHLRRNVRSSTVSSLHSVPTYLGLVAPYEARKELSSWGECLIYPAQPVTGWPHAITRSD